MIRVRVVDRFAGLPPYQQRRMTDAQVKRWNDAQADRLDQLAQDHVEGRI